MCLVPRDIVGHNMSELNHRPHGIHHRHGQRPHRRRRRTEVRCSEFHHPHVRSDDRLGIRRRWQGTSAPHHRIRWVGVDPERLEGLRIVLVSARVLFLRLVALLPVVIFTGPPSGDTVASTATAHFRPEPRLQRVDWLGPTQRDPRTEVSRETFGPNPPTFTRVWFPASR